MMTYIIKNKTDVLATIEVIVSLHKFIAVKTYIDIEEYSLFLLKQTPERRVQIIKIFDGINHLKQVIYEHHFKDVQKYDHKKVFKEIEEFVETIGDAFGLRIVKD